MTDFEGDRAHLRDNYGSQVVRTALIFTFYMDTAKRASDSQQLFFSSPFEKISFTRNGKYVL